jgi:hypothetical protein
MVIWYLWDIAQRLGDQFDPVEIAHSSEHVGGVGTLPAERLEQAERLHGSQHTREQALAGVGGEEPAAELAQQGVAEAGVGELELSRPLTKPDFSRAVVARS